VVPVEPGATGVIHGLPLGEGELGSHRSKGPPPSIRDAVLTVIQPGEDVTVGVVADRLNVMGVNANRNSVSNELGRWAQEGKLERPARGIYRVIMTHPNGDHSRNV